MHRLLAALPLVLFSACVTQDYVGRDYAPTEYVEVFFAERDVQRPFEIMGRDRAEAPEALTTEQIVAQIVTEAKKHGADAVLIDAMDLQQVGSTTNTFGEQKQKAQYYATTDGKLHTRHEPTGSYRETSYSSAVRDRVVQARFLKYRQ